MLQEYRGDRGCFSFSGIRDTFQSTFSLQNPLSLKGQFRCAFWATLSQHDSLRVTTVSARIVVPL